VKSEERFIRAFRRFLSGNMARNGEWRAYCPLHEEPGRSKSPSASLNFKEDKWHCMSCGEGGSIRSLYRTMLNHKNLKVPKKREEPSNVVKLTDKRAPTGRKMPTHKQLKQWHQRLLGNSRALAIMTEQRGLSIDTLERFLIGYDGQRFTIPVYDEEGDLVNVRRYKPNAKSHKDKMMSWGTGTGVGRIYGLDTLANADEVLLTEGEMDRLIGIQNKLPAVTHTSGASVFKMEWAPYFKDKDVYIAYDEDSSGDQGAMKAAQILKTSARSVHRVKLGTGIKGGDVTDFFVTLGGSADDMWMLMHEATPLFVRKGVHEVPDKGRTVSVEESQSVEYDEPLELTVMVAGKQTPPYVVPRKIIGTCSQSAGAVCAVCPFAVEDGKREVLISADDERLLQFVDASNKRTNELHREITEAKCIKHVEFEVPDSYSVEELVVTPSVAHRSEAVETPIHRRVYNVGTYRTPVNQLARIVGKQTPDPRSQRGTFMGWHLEPVNTDLDTFKMTPELNKQLQRFRNERGQSPLEKCMEISEDISANVSHIYGRAILHAAYDLVWHSVTSFNFNDKPVTKGWLECLVIGDTRTGKSEAANAMIGHYGCGTLKSCESVSYAGLVGGAQQLGAKQWMVTWGTLPLNDRRLVVLDEMSGLYTSNNGNRDSKGIIEAMSSIRSEGKAQITKIVTEETSARTRLIWISNPLDDNRLSESSGSALGAIKHLIRNPEDIARFDFTVAVANDEVPSSVINSTKHRRVKHVYNSDLCNSLVMWAWSRRADQIKWNGRAEDAVFAAAEDVGARYVPDPPLVQIENIRMKIARLAVAIAARTYSASATGECVIVKVQHVKAAVDFLDAVYGTEAMGYKRHSSTVQEDRRRALAGMSAAREYLKNNDHLIDVLQAVGATTFRPRDFEEIGGVDRDEANLIVKKFVGWRMIRRGSQGRMKMEPSLVKLLRELEDDH
jgi:hypothetical protein